MKHVCQGQGDFKCVKWEQKTEFSLTPLLHPPLVINKAFRILLK